MMKGAVKNMCGPAFPHESPVEPAAENDAEQDRRDDRPAEHADLAEARGERRLGILAKRRLRSAAGARRSPSSCWRLERAIMGRLAGKGVSRSPSGRPPRLR